VTFFENGSTALLMQTFKFSTVELFFWGLLQILAKSYSVFLPLSLKDRVYLHNQIVV